jgi:hypothetical protein
LQYDKRRKIMKTLLCGIAAVTALTVAGPAFAQGGSWGRFGANVASVNDSYAYYSPRTPYRWRYRRSYQNSSNRAFGSGYGNSYAFGYEKQVVRQRPDGVVPNNYGSYCGQLPKAC